MKQRKSTHTTSYEVQKVYSRLGVALANVMQAAPAHLEESARYCGKELHGQQKPKAA
ncbi:hypothetical protein [Shewanella sp. Isolate7]|uniref:hypothetical protein n=1 Tax=Shewanella sp. Isolate7 TaxID=2908528 RepID=UPI001EFD3A53|nr:hypothetical protein [Shewanella sp. Isolate7]MCG9721859.1 hypothetical protein [Shewanella sp. Isolate7]